MGRLNARTSNWRVVGLNHCFADQSRIGQELGLHKSSVSEMLTRLEGLEWIRRIKDTDDARRRIVELTALGYRRFREACKILFRWKIMRPQLDELIQGLERDRPFNEAFERTWCGIARIARLYGDTSTCDFYDRQYSFDVPELTEWEYRTRRTFGTECGPRIPDVIIRFLYRWERHYGGRHVGPRGDHPSRRDIRTDQD